MSEHLASLFGSAVGTLTSSPARSFELFTEITSMDEAACDAWVGRIRCGDTDRVTMFRAWYSRGNFGQLAGAAEISMNSLGARIPIGGQFGDITYPVNAPLAITMGFAVNEALVGNYADAMEALDGVQSAGAEHLVAWVRAVVYGAAERWTDVIDEVRGAGGWPDRFLAAAAGVAWGCSPRLNAGSPNPMRPRRGEACAPAIAWYLAMTRSGQGNEDGAAALLEGLQATHPDAKVAAALKDPTYRLVTTTADKIASRKDPRDPSSAVADTSGREKLLAEAQAELDRQIGLNRVKDQIEAYRAATQMANILAGLGVIAEPRPVETSRKDFVAEYEGQSAIKTARTIDRAMGGVLFIDEAFTLVQERDGRADPFGTEALDTLLARMENDRDRLVVIIAGYGADIDRLLESNDELRSRFATRLEFDSYSPDEIVDIAKVIAVSTDSSIADEAAKRVLEAASLLSQRTLNGKPALDIAGNGRYARQLVEAGEQSRDMGGVLGRGDGLVHTRPQTVPASVLETLHIRSLHIPPVRRA